jgi:hypothetical protein
MLGFCQATLFLNVCYTMVLTLYGSPLSPSTSLVQVILKEKNVPYEDFTLNILTGENRAEKWKKIAPFGQVPWIVVGRQWFLLKLSAPPIMMVE